MSGDGIWYYSYNLIFLVMRFALLPTASMRVVWPINEKNLAEAVWRIVVQCRISSTGAPQRADAR